MRQGCAALALSQEHDTCYAISVLNMLTQSDKLMRYVTHNIATLIRTLTSAQLDQMYEWAYTKSKSCPIQADDKRLAFAARFIRNMMNRKHGRMDRDGQVMRRVLVNDADEGLHYGFPPLVLLNVLLVALGMPVRTLKVSVQRSVMSLSGLLQFTQQRVTPMFDHAQVPSFAQALSKLTSDVRVPDKTRYVGVDDTSHHFHIDMLGTNNVPPQGYKLEGCIFHIGGSAEDPTNLQGHVFAGVKCNTEQWLVDSNWGNRAQLTWNRGIDIGSRAWHNFVDMYNLKGTPQVLVRMFMSDHTSMSLTDSLYAFDVATLTRVSTAWTNQHNVDIRRADIALQRRIFQRTMPSHVSRTTTLNQKDTLKSMMSRDRTQPRPAAPIGGSTTRRRRRLPV